jgi:hypothetical protein
MRIITIDRRNFLRGMSSSQWTDEGGFSPQSKGFEISQTGLRGVLQNGRGLSEDSTNIADNVIAATKYASGSSFIYYALGSGGNIYTTDPTGTITHTVKTTDSAKTYNSFSDIIVYGGNLYATSTTDILKSDLAFSSVDNDWWTATKSKSALTSGVPHKLFDFQGVMFITNGNKLAKWDDTTATDATLTLPTGWIITDAEIINNRIYLAACYGVNDTTKNTINKIFVWDGYSISWLSEIPIYEPTIAFLQQVNGLLYFFAGHSLFVSDGSSYQRVFNFPYETMAPNFHTKEVYDGVLYFKGYQGIIAYDTITKAASYPIYTTSTINVIIIGHVYYIDLYGETNKFWQCSTNNAGQSFYSNWYDLGSPHYIRKIEVVFPDALTTGSTYDFSLYDEKESLHTQTISYALDGGIKFKTYMLNKLVNRFQLKITSTNSANKAIVAIRIYAEPSERHTTK